MFSKFLKIAEGIAADIENRAKQFAGAKSMGRVASVTAMIAYLPDNDADKDEIKKGVQAISKHSGGIYPLTDMLDAVNKRVTTLEFDADMGEGELMQEIAPAANTPEADFLVRVAIAVGKASGEPGEDPFSPEEKEVARRIASKLNLTASDFGL